LEFREQIELQRFRQRRHFRRAQLVEDDLEHCRLTNTRPAQFKEGRFEIAPDGGWKTAAP
jgi:hypothetical protein